MTTAPTRTSRTPGSSFRRAAAVGATALTVGAGLIGTATPASADDRTHVAVFKVGPSTDGTGSYWNVGNDAFTVVGYVDGYDFTVVDEDEHQICGPTTPAANHVWYQCEVPAQELGEQKIWAAGKDADGDVVVTRPLTLWVYDTPNPPADFEARPLTDLQTTFPDAVEQSAVLTGKASPNNEITLGTAGDHETIATTTTDADGDFSIELPAPNAAGKAEFAVVQKRYGVGAPLWSAVSIDYGAGVSVTTPSDGATLPQDEPVEIVGTAGASAMVRVAEADAPDTALAEVVAGTDGTFTLPAFDLPVGEHDLVVEAISKGANATRTDLAVSVGATPPEAAPGVAITGPEDGTYDAPPTWTRVTGSAAPGAAVALRSAWGPIGSTTAGDDGTWAIWGGFGPTATYELVASQTRADGTTSESPVFRLAADVERRDVVITTPGGAYDPSGVTAVSGEADPGATVVLSASWGALEPAVTADDAGHWTYWGFFGPTARYELTATQTRTDGTTSTSAPVTLTPPAPEAAPVVITTPSGEYLPGGMTVVRGSATPRAEVDIVASWGPMGTVVADDEGAWEYAGFFGPTATYELTAVQRLADGTSSSSEPIVLTPAAAADVPGKGTIQSRIEHVTAEVGGVARLRFRDPTATEPYRVHFTLDGREYVNDVGTVTNDPFTSLDPADAFIRGFGAGHHVIGVFSEGEQIDTLEFEV